MCYPIEPKERVYVKGYEFFLLLKILVCMELKFLKREQ